MPLAVRSTTKPWVRAIGELEPVGAEDPQRALALAKHNAGVTKSQDFKGFADEELKHVGAKDGFRPCAEPAPKKGYESFMDTVKRLKEKELAKKPEAKDTLEPVGDELWTPGHKNPVPAGWLKLSKEAMRAAGEAQVAAAKYDRYRPDNKSLFSALRRLNEAQNKGDEAKLRKEAATIMAETASKRAKDTELPVPVKTSNLVPMPSGERNEERYAPRPVGDAYKAHDPWYGERIKELEEEVERCKKAGEPYKDELRDIAEYKKEDAEREKHTKRARGGDRKRAKDNAFERGDAVKVTKTPAAGAIGVIVGRTSLGQWKVKFEDGNTGAFDAASLRLLDGSRMSDRKHATDSIQEQISGSEPKDHLHRAALRAGAAKARDANLNNLSLPELRQELRTVRDKLGKKHSPQMDKVWKNDVERLMSLIKAKSGAKDEYHFAKQRSGSGPADHLHRAAQYEIQGDRARALDSYRAAASGYRKANDRANEAKARDGVEACQSRFAAQYDHPSAGRVKVCDSAEQAVRTAVERTRAGEVVRVDGKTVRPGRARDTQQGLGYSDKRKCLSCAGVGERTSGNKCVTCNGTGKVKVKDDTGGPPPVDEPAYPGMPDPVRTDDAKLCEECGKESQEPRKPNEHMDSEGLCKHCKVKLGYRATDEHLGFKKLEGKLAHEKGVSDPAAVAASIGRKKYGATGMARKAAAGRAKDAREVQPV
jgi:hypothetical protein